MEPRIDYLKVVRGPDTCLAQGHFSQAAWASFSRNL
jgi:hypothetical protein